MDMDTWLCLRTRLGSEPRPGKPDFQKWHLWSQLCVFRERETLLG